MANLSNEQIFRIANYTVPYLGTIICSNVSKYSIDETISEMRKNGKHFKAVRPEWFDEYYNYVDVKTYGYSDYSYGHPRYCYDLSMPAVFQPYGVVGSDIGLGEQADYQAVVFVDFSTTDTHLSNDFRQKWREKSSNAGIDNLASPLFMNYDDGYDSTFWYLFLAAINDKIYEERFEEIVSRAAFYGFTEDMIRDWCRAVQFVVGGGKLSPDCDLELDSKEAREFFLHEGRNENAEEG